MRIRCYFPTRWILLNYCALVTVALTTLHHCEAFVFFTLNNKSVANKIFRNNAKVEAVPFDSSFAGISVYRYMHTGRCVPPPSLRSTCLSAFSNSDLPGEQDDTDDDYYMRLFEEEEEHGKDDEETEPETTEAEKRDQQRLSYEQAEQTYKERKAKHFEWNAALEDVKRSGTQARRTRRDDKKREKMVSQAEQMAMRKLGFKRQPSRPKRTLRNGQNSQHHNVDSGGNATNNRDTCNGNENEIEDNHTGSEVASTDYERYQIAVGVYTRLLERLEEMEQEARLRASDLVSEHAAQMAERMIGNICTTLSVDQQSATRKSSNITKEQIKRVQQAREKEQRQREDFTEMVLADEAPCVGGTNGIVSISTSDLLAILHIRANVTNSSRAVKRETVLKFIQQSFEKKLF